MIRREATPTRMSEPLCRVGTSSQSTVSVGRMADQSGFQP